MKIFTKNNFTDNTTMRIATLILFFGMNCSLAVSSLQNYGFSSQATLYSGLDGHGDDRSITNVKVFYNPIAEQISVSFGLSISGQVQVKIMDALGNEVMQLYNEHTETGVHSLNFNTNGRLSSGFYFVRVVQGSDTIIKRISIR